MVGKVPQKEKPDLQQGDELWSLMRELSNITRKSRMFKMGDKVTVEKK